MPKEMVEKEIDGRKYEITQFMTTKSLQVLQKLIKYGGEPIALITSFAGSDKEMDPVTEVNLITKTVRELCEKLNEPAVLDLIKDLSSGTTLLCDGKKIEFEGHYQTDLGHLFKVIFAVVEVQYGSFFAEAVSKMQTMMPQPKPTLVK